MAVVNRIPRRVFSPAVRIADRRQVPGRVVFPGGDNASGPSSGLQPTGSRLGAGGAVPVGINLGIEPAAASLELERAPTKNESLAFVQPDSCKVSQLKNQSIGSFSVLVRKSV